MTDFVDHDGIPLFVNDFTHTAHDVDGTSIDVIKTNGNLWLSGPAVMEAMGFQPDGAGGGYARRLSRIDHPDIIKIIDTPFRFADGRRNKGSLISPRAVHRFAEGRVKGFNAIKAYAFLQWMDETLWTEGDEKTWSPKRPVPAAVEPVFREVIRVRDENQYGEPLDPLRPTGPYHGLGHFGPLRHDEIEFAIDDSDIPQRVRRIELDDDLLIDDEDDFSPLTSWLKTAA
ncbi:hypothetical protein [Roseovarius sp.]|uniref:hypothetical protein n=1 Tax=Roseovarius sp. TaxID=1486281 RepID=UPI003A96DD5B